MDSSKNLPKITSDSQIPVSESAASFALVNAAQYEEMYNESIADPEAFWNKKASERLEWFKEWDTTMNCDFSTASVKWFEGGKINACYNCVDRHLEKHRNQAAILWEGDEPADTKSLTFLELHREVSKFANVLKEQGVTKGDRVIIYMPMTPEIAITVLACARIGAVHSVVFGGFSAPAIRDRIEDCQPKLIVTADAGYRGGRVIPLKNNIDAALEGNDEMKSIVLKRTGNEIKWRSNDIWWHEVMATASPNCPCEQMDSEDPLFILYTSGSTGKPKGVLHTTAGYLLYAGMTHQYIFDYHPGDTYWCTADLGWITGHSYVIYGPLSNAATTLMFEGGPNYPDWGRFWDIIEKHQVNIFYTAPTAIRALAKNGENLPQTKNLTSLRILGTVGEPINPEAWSWYYNVVGQGKCQIVDTWWQTETGGIMITPLPGVTMLKPGSATRPFFGIQPVIVDADNVELEGVCSGNLCIKTPWPGQMRGVYGDQQRFFDTYFSQFPGRYFSGDGCRRDEDGYHWITGRVDDVINVSGHRFGTAEIESTLVLHSAVAEAAVIGVPHEITGQALAAFVVCNLNITASAELRGDLIQHVRKEIGPIATIYKLFFVDSVPCTRSGKIMRRILRKLADGDISNLGDTSTLANDDSVVSISNVLETESKLAAEEEESK